METQNRQKLKDLSLSGFKSIAAKQIIEFGDINVLIGANGAGKSNLVSFFKLLQNRSRVEFPAIPA